VSFDRCIDRAAGASGPPPVDFHWPLAAGKPNTTGFDRWRLTAATPGADSEPLFLPTAFGARLAMLACHRGTFAPQGWYRRLPRHHGQPANTTARPAHQAGSRIGDRPSGATGAGNPGGRPGRKPAGAGPDPAGQHTTRGVSGAGAPPAAALGRTNHGLREPGPFPLLPHPATDPWVRPGMRLPRRCPAAPPLSPVGAGRPAPVAPTKPGARGTPLPMDASDVSSPTLPGISKHYALYLG